MTSNLPSTTFATHSGKWVIDKDADIGIDVYVTNDKRRMLSLKGTKRALGLAGAGSTAIARNLNRMWIKPFLTNELEAWLEELEKDHIDRMKVDRGHAIIPIEAALFVDICQAYINAQKAGIFADKHGKVADRWRKQDDIANKLFHIMSAFAKIGLIALIDEITGYQEVRDRDALQQILDKYLRDFRGPWTKTFPDEFYENLFRLKGWSYRPLSVKRPGVVGHWTTDLIYARLAPGVLEELKKRNPTVSPGRRRHKHHQWLSDDHGVPELKRLIDNVMFLMVGHTKWDVFYRALQRARPKINSNLLLPLPDGVEEEQ